MTREESWLKQYNELKAWVEEHHHYPPRHTKAYNFYRYNVKLKNKGELDENKSRLWDEIDSLRTHEHTGGRRKKVSLNPSLF